MGNIIDLDILRPEAKIVKLGGHEIDVSFIPAGITFDLDAIVQELMKLDGKKVQTDREEMKRAFDIGVRLCSVFCARKFPDMTAEWFYDNASTDQVTQFANAIQESLTKTYSGVEAHAKN